MTKKETLHRLLLHTSMSICCHYNTQCEVYGMNMAEAMYRDTHVRWAAHCGNKQNLFCCCMHFNWHHLETQYPVLTIHPLNQVP